MEISCDASPYTVSAKEHGKKHFVRLVNPIPGSLLSHFLFVQTGLFYLLESYLPKLDSKNRYSISLITNIPLISPFRQLFSDLCLLNKIKLKIQASAESEILRADRIGQIPKVSSKKAVIAFSGGKDSLWNLMWAQKKFGRENVLAVHIEGLNANQATRERKMVIRQANELGFNLQIIKIKNNFDTHDTISRGGYSYYMFIAGIIIPAAMEFGASAIIMEGFQFPQDIQRFNQVLKEIDIPIKIVWRDIGETEVVRELVKYRPRWSSYICACDRNLKNHKLFRSLLFAAIPKFEIDDTDCGCCYKCRLKYVSRILYDPSLRQTGIQSYLVYVLLGIATWSYFSPFEKEWLDLLARACRKYNLPTYIIRAIYQLQNEDFSALAKALTQFAKNLKPSS